MRKLKLREGRWQKLSQGAAQASLPLEFTQDASLPSWVTLSGGKRGGPPGAACEDEARGTRQKTAPSPLLSSSCSVAHLQCQALNRLQGPADSADAVRAASGLWESPVTLRPPVCHHSVYPSLSPPAQGSGIQEERGPAPGPEASSPCCCCRGNGRASIFSQPLFPARLPPAPAMSGRPAAGRRTRAGTGRRKEQQEEERTDGAGRG